MRTKKGKATLPGQLQPPGPHGHPDVALPISNHTLKKGCNGGKKQENPLFTPCRGSNGEGDGYASLRIGNFRLGEKRPHCQAGYPLFCCRNDFHINIFFIFNINRIRYIVDCFNIALLFHCKNILKKQLVFLTLGRVHSFSF